MGNERGLEKVLREISPPKLMNSSSHTIYYILLPNIPPFDNFPQSLHTIVAYIIPQTLRNLKFFKNFR